MRILLISNMYPDKKHPGFGVFVKHSANMLSANGYTLEKVVRIKKNNRLIKLIDYVLFYFRIFFKVLTTKSEIIYVHFAAHPSIPILLSIFFRKNLKVVTNVHGTDVVPENVIHKLFQPFVKMLLQKSNIIISPSNYFKELVRERYGIEDKKIKVFPSGGINKEIFYPINEQSKRYDEFDLNKREQYLGFVGRIEYGKGWKTLLSAFRILKEERNLSGWKIIFVGYGDEAEIFKETVREYNLDNDIVYFQYLQQEELNHIYNIIDYFCFPTERKGESLGLVGIEAMATGTPVIGSNIAGLKSYISDGKNGFLFDAGNVDDLADVIEDALTKSASPEKNNAIRSNALKTSNRYEVNNIKSILIDIFEDLNQEELD
ncbi:Glycosyltransferase involved in cell wall bisynthesis [Terribacillus aidingensis]|uniref:Glycosyltransferase involved in cell wall bisynthesis n=1 Tax=Terribacillus aidingensis TaxID=586416 RepID=A0A285N5M1_9BACI|nr:glycosyltransferase family 4 protein [Terribacillus aidingensis]SNZ04765.1 Glycosyltransferase involved in cell wall bisynthesis [Terribacillus aidingensis]